MKVKVQYPDPELALIEWLTDNFPEAIRADGTPTDDTEWTVGVGVPTDWVKLTSPTHVEVSWDTTPEHLASVYLTAHVHLIVHAADAGTAKRIALRIFGIIDGGVDGHPDIDQGRNDTRPLPSKDPLTTAELVSWWVDVIVRARTITDPGS